MDATTPHWSLVNIGSGNGLVPSWRHQAITWANVDIDPCRHMTSLGHYELRHYHTAITSQLFGINHGLVALNSNIKILTSYVSHSRFRESTGLTTKWIAGCYRQTRPPYSLSILSGWTLTFSSSIMSSVEISCIMHKKCIAGKILCARALTGLLGIPDHLKFACQRTVYIY